jgi:DNA-binding response OmpR family regulator
VQYGAATAPVGVLVVDDDAGWTEIVADDLARDDVSVVVVDNGLDALAAAEHTQPRMIIVDVGLSDVDGLQLCRRLRAISDAHIIMVTPRCDAPITTGGLAGADDVLTKPLSCGLVADRIRAVVGRRSPSPRGGTVLARVDDSTGKQKFGPLSVVIARREVFVADEQISLTRTQFDILATLAQRAGRLTTRRELLDAVWGPLWAGSPNVIDVHIGLLRRRLGDDPAQPLLVLNVRGLGWRLAR